MAGSGLVIVKQPAAPPNTVLPPVRVGVGPLGWTPTVFTTATPINYGNVVAGSNSLPAGISDTYFHARFVGYLIPTQTGNYTLGVNASDGCSLFLNDRAIVSNIEGTDAAHSTAAFTQSDAIYLSAGVKYQIVVEWQHGSGASYELQLLWTAPANSSLVVLIPTANLWQDAGKVNSGLQGAWWKGTSGLWYPAGAGTIDFASGVHPNKQLDNIADGSTYARVKGTALTSGSVDPSLVGVLAKGSIPPALNGGFTYTSTTTSITWSWGAQTAVYRADGTVTVIGAGSQAITGLTNLGVYEFYPVYDEVSATLKFLGNTDFTFPALVGATGDGSTSYVTGDTSRAQMGSFSAEVWVKTTSVSVQPLFDLSAPLIIGTTGNKSFHAWFQSSTIQAYALLGASSITTLYNGGAGTNVKLNDGVYHHIVMTWDNVGFLFSVYVDGALAGQTTLANAMTSISTMYWHIGGIGGKAGWTETANAFYAGTMSHAIIYTSVLALSDVQALYQAAVNISVAQYETIVAAQSPLNSWKLNETSGTAAADSGSAADNGTYRGTVTLNNAGNTFAALGSPAIAYKKKTYAMAQAAANQGRMPLSGGSIEATATSGGSGGGGGSDGSGTCFSPNTKVKTQRGDVPFYDIRHGDLVLTARNTWRRVLSVTGSKHAGEMLDMGDGELVTKGHHFQSNTEWVRVAELGIFPTVVPYDGMIQNLRIEADADDDGSALDTEHSYTLANGHKVHNIMGTT